MERIRPSGLTLSKSIPQQQVLPFRRVPLKGDDEGRNFQMLEKGVSVCEGSVSKFRP